MKYIQKICLLTVVFLMSTPSSANSINSKSPLLKKLLEGSKKSFLVVDIYCDSMCTINYINRSTVCMSLNNEKNRDQCIEDAKEKEDQCKMNCS